MTHTNKKIITALLVLLFVAGGVTTYWVWSDMQTQLDFPIKIKANTPLIYTIKPRMSLQQIVQDLTQKEILNNPYYFTLEARLHSSASRLKAGEYRLDSKITQRQLLNKFVSGEVIQHTLALIEGWSYRQAIHAVSNNKILVKTLRDTDSKTVMSAIGYAGVHPEGRFFPDTYHFPYGMTDVEYLQRAYEKMISVLNEEWQQREKDLPYKTADEALIMASIIEKETAVTDERAQIAGVFVRRLQKKMRLQTDPTVIYAMGDDYNGNIRRKDLKIASLYNTYLYAGLPPTPIALPGAEAIHAALHPQDGVSLYFVAKKDGTHYFSQTLKEHNRAVGKYQLDR